MITIDLTDLELVKELSVYNNNYYKHKNSNTDTLLFVHTDEQFSTDDVYVCSGKDRIFIGSFQNFYCDDILRINLGEQCT